MAENFKEEKIWSKKNPEDKEKEPSSKKEMSPIEKETLDFILESSCELGPEMERLYQHFHENPELGGEEFETARKVKEYLENLGIEIAGDKIGGTGIIAIIRGKEGGPAIALRADMDALPIQEDKNHSPRSQKEGVMHACGHDVHTAGLMGAAKIFKELAEKEKLEGDIILMFQPSEEKTHQKKSGAIPMIKFLERSGLRDKIGAFFGMHVKGDLERGQINVREGIQMASSGEIDIKIKGPGGHIMDAYELPNIHLIFSEITTELHKIFEPLARDKETLVASARTKYQGEGYNVLPAEGESTWVVRIASPLFREVSADIQNKIKEVVEEVIQRNAEGGTVEMEIKRRPGYRPVVHRDPNLVGIAEDSAHKALTSCQKEEKLMMGGEDFSFYLERLRGKEIPGVFLMVGAANPEKGIPKVSHHGPDFEVDPEVMKDLAALHAVFSLKAIEYLKRKKESESEKI